MKTKNLIKQLQELKKPVQIITSQYLKFSLSSVNSDIKINEHNILYFKKNETLTIKYAGSPHWEEYIDNKKLISTWEGLELIEQVAFQESIYKIAIIYKTINSIKQLKEITSFLDEFYSLIKYTSNTMIKLDKEKVIFGLRPIEIDSEIKEHFHNQKRENFDFKISKNVEMLVYESTYDKKELEQMINLFSKDNDYMLSKLDDEKLINKYINDKKEK
jgi:hypothetical protein